MTAEFILFVVLAIVAVLAALGMLLSRNAVHSALFLVTNFGAVAILYLMLNAPFLAVAQVTVYAGAIMVLFLFVIMLLGVDRMRHPEPRVRFHVPIAILLTAVLLVALGYTLAAQGGALGSGKALDPSTFATPEALATGLFSAYLLPFEITSLLLLVAMIGAVVLTREETLAAMRRRSSAALIPADPGVTFQALPDKPLPELQQEVDRAR